MQIDAGRGLRSLLCCFTIFYLLLAVISRLPGQALGTWDQNAPLSDSFHYLPPLPPLSSHHDRKRKKIQGQKGVTGDRDKTCLVHILAHSLFSYSTQTDRHPRSYLSNVIISHMMLRASVLTELQIKKVSNKALRKHPPPCAWPRFLSARCETHSPP